MLSIFDQSGMHRLFYHLVMFSFWRSTRLCCSLLLKIVSLLLGTVIMLLCFDMTIGVNIDLHVLADTVGKLHSFTLFL